MSRPTAESGLRSLRFQGVDFAYEGALQPLFENLNFHLDGSWTGLVGANGAGKTTMLRLAVGELDPTAGRVQRPLRCLCCRQRTDAVPEGLDELLASDEGEAWRWKAALAVEPEWIERWDSCSHGERKRAQLAVALWRDPDLLAVDEPSNHVDAEARALMADALAAFRGVGLLVSHDRELLDRLVCRCVHLDPPRARLLKGNFGEIRERLRQEDASARHALDEANHELKRLRREADRRRREVEGSKKRLSKRGLAKGDADGRGKIDKARLTGKDRGAGQGYRRAQGQVERLQERITGMEIRKDRATGVRLLGGDCHRDRLWHLPAGRIHLGTRELRHPDLAMEPGDRVAVVGPNGAGKSRLVDHVVASLDMPSERLLYLPQEIHARRGREILAQVRSLPRDELGRCMTLVSRLGSRPERLLRSENPSPGETRKLLLALGLSLEPWLVILDEPTNHLDLPSIEALEEALDDCRCALFLVSHDRVFLRGLVDRVWLIRPEGQGRRLMVDRRCDELLGH